MSLKEKVVKLEKDGKSVEEMVKELKVSKVVVYSMLGKKLNNNSSDKLNKSDMMSILWLFGGSSVKEMSEELKGNYSWCWSICNKMEKNKNKMEEVYNKFNDMVEEKGIEKLEKEFMKECKSSKEEKEKKDNK